jgi:hypothetical protein
MKLNDEMISKIAAYQDVPESEISAYLEALKDEEKGLIIKEVTKVLDTYKPNILDSLNLAEGVGGKSIVIDKIAKGKKGKFVRIIHAKKGWSAGERNILLIEESGKNKSTIYALPKGEFLYKKSKGIYTTAKFEEFDSLDNEEIFAFSLVTTNGAPICY